MKTQFKVMEKFCEEEKKLFYSVSREDGEAFDGGVVAYNFDHTEEGARHAIACQKSLESHLN